MSLNVFLQRSRATEPFRDAVAAFLRDRRSGERIAFHLHSPPVKVERTLTRVLEAYPELEIERVEIEGVSGCEFFRGRATIHAEDQVRRVRFHWDCRWRAEQEGWTDYFGFADQTRAAREFGYDCFRTWEEEKVIRVGKVVAPEEDGMLEVEPV
jgi:hypothetical protein